VKAAALRAGLILLLELPFELLPAVGRQLLEGSRKAALCIGVKAPPPAGTARRSRCASGWTAAPWCGGALCSLYGAVAAQGAIVQSSRYPVSSRGSVAEGLPMDRWCITPHALQVYLR
jgi:hypothetical protein